MIKYIHTDDRVSGTSLAISHTLLACFLGTLLDLMLCIHQYYSVYCKTTKKCLLPENIGLLTLVPRSLPVLTLQMLTKIHREHTLLSSEVKLLFGFQTLPVWTGREAAARSHEL